MKITDHVKEFPVMYATAAALVGVLGGTMTITLPADHKIAQLETELAQTWQQRQSWEQQQTDYHRQDKIDQIDFQLRYISNEINRINSIPEYLDRPITPQEEWQVETLKEDWLILKDRRDELAHQ